MGACTLTFAFHGRAVEELNEVLEVEDALYEMLADGEEMDGHEMAAQARRIFVLTDNGEATFRRLQPFLRNAGLLDEMTATAEPQDGGEVIVLWPAAPAPAPAA
jgi:hypothetical protein